jgi:LCP family protein required for cell wall assembly
MKRTDRLKARKRQKRYTWVKIFLALLLIGGLVVGILSFDAVRTWAGKHYFRMRYQGVEITEEEDPGLLEALAKRPELKEPLNILFIGVDKGSVPGEEEDTEYFRSDVMILASVNVLKKKAVLVSIPRDTKVAVSGYGDQKINATHSLGGPSAAVEAVSELSGLDIHDYAEVDFEAFKEIVNAVGGVPFHLEYDILDPKVGALPKGDLLLYGDEALILVRSRNLPRGDIDRIENQHNFLKSLMEKAINVRDIQALMDILDATVKYLDTTLDADLIFDLAELLQGMDIDDVEFVTLPGDSPEPGYGQPWYFVHDEAAAEELFRNIRLYGSTRSPTEELAVVEEEVVEVDRSSFQLLVLNGARWEGLASGVAVVLGNKGYMDIETGDTNNPYQYTTVYYAPGYEEAARMVASDLDPEEEFILEENEEVAEANDADVVLVLGKDYLST